MNESPDIPDTERDLYPKYHIYNFDNEMKHKYCFYFVLDLHHDEFAEAAIWTYINACQEKYPELANDLHAKMSAIKAQKMAEELKEPTV